MNVSIAGPDLHKGALCEPILRALPEWFGIEDAIVHYVHEIERSPTFLAHQGTDVVGFLTLKEHSPYAAEVYVMGIRVEVHRQGIGKALIEEAEAFLRGKGIEYLQVKTLSQSSPDPNYAKTRVFYEAMDFRTLEELTDLWGKENPCLLMIKRL